VGSVLVAVARPAGEPFGVALTIMLVLALIGLVIAVLIPRQSTEAAQQTDPSTAAAR
jgi:Tfp pilus assembly protein PilX